MQSSELEEPFLQDVQHHLHVQHHQHHHDPDNIVVGVNWGPPYLQLTVKIADHQVYKLVSSGLVRY